MSVCMPLEAELASHREKNERASDEMCCIMFPARIPAPSSINLRTLVKPNSTDKTLINLYKLSINL